MKGSHYLVLSAAALAVVSCVQPYPVANPAVPTTGASVVPAAPARPGQYMALPGQAVQAVNPDTDAAFEQQVAAYSQGAASPVAAPQVPVAPVVPTAPYQQPMVTPEAQPGLAVTTPAQPTVQNPMMVPTQPAAVPTPVGGKIDYTLKITNNTPGRLFIEAQDAAGTIYPCGFMSTMQSFSTPMTQADPIKGPVTVVVRDPDKPDTPEIRRYKIDPPAQYAGKTFGIAVIPGGIYQTSLDGVVYYTSPPQPRSVVPTPAPVPAAPTADAAPAAATATPAAEPAPIPEPAPAQ